MGRTFKLSVYRGCVLAVSMAIFLTGCQRAQTPALTPASILSEAAVDRQQTEERYRGQRLDITGVVAARALKDGEALEVSEYDPLSDTSRVKSAAGRPVIVFQTAASDRVICLLLEDAAGEAATAVVGAQVTLSCEFQQFVEQGSEVSALLSECYVARDYQ